MRDHTEDSEIVASNEEEENVDCDEEEEDEESKSISQKEFSAEYYRDVLINVEDQVETSKLVLQLVTDSRFNMTQINGQRKLGGPPPGWKGPAPGPGCEVFVGKIPRTLYEHEIYPIFRRMGEVYEIRLMMDFSGTNRGYCFVMFGEPEYARRAINELDNFEIRPGRRIGVVASINNCRLYVGQLPPDVHSETVIKKIYDITDDVGQVAVYRNANDQARYALISYKTHRGAAMARRRLVPDRASLFGGAEVSIDWAHPSMFPSNVVEDTGICDDRGNLEISRLIVGNENKRCQNRRRARDEFLDHSIRAYLQSDRVLDQMIPRSKQNLLQNQGFNNCLDSINALGMKNFHVFDQNENENLNSRNYIYQRHNLRVGKNRPNKSEISRKSRYSNSSYDLVAGSSAGSSESSGCSSQSSVSTLNSFNPSKYNSEFFYNVNDQGNIKSGESASSGDQEVQKNDLESLNLFENYTFSGNSQDAENEDNFNDCSAIFENEVETNNAVKNSMGDNASKDFYNKNCSKIVVSGRENDQKLRQQRNKSSGRNSIFDNNDDIYNLVQKSIKQIETFPKTVGVPLKNMLQKSAFDNDNDLGQFTNNRSSGVEIDRMNPNIYFQNHEEDNHNRSQFFNRNGTSTSNKNIKNSRLVTENYLMHHHYHNQQSENRVPYAQGKIASSLDSRNFSYASNNSSAKKSALLSAQISLNAHDFSSNNLSINNPIVYSNSGVSSSSGEHSSALRTSNPTFIPRDNLSMMNFHPAQNFSRNIMQQVGPHNQNKKYPNSRIIPKGGRPILSRSHVRLSNEN